MKTNHYRLIEAIQVLNPADKFAAKRIEYIGLRQVNGECVFVNEVIVETGSAMIHGRSAGRTSWHMLPIDQLVGIEVELKAPTGAWFKDAETLPAVIAKLKLEQKKGA